MSVLETRVAEKSVRKPGLSWFRLSYWLLEDSEHSPAYGVCVRKRVMQDSLPINGWLPEEVSCHAWLDGHRENILGVIRLLAKNTVTPATMEYILDDNYIEGKIISPDEESAWLEEDLSFMLEQDGMLPTQRCGRMFLIKLISYTVRLSDTDGFSVRKAGCALAKEYGKTWHQVERNIRTAVLQAKKYADTHPVAPQSIFTHSENEMSPTRLIAFYGSRLKNIE